MRQSTLLMCLGFVLSYNLAAAPYTKLDPSGESLPADAERWSCVLDQASNTIWVHSSTPTDTTTTSGHPWPGESVESIASPTSRACAESQQCSPREQLARLNATAFCGSNQWHLPTKDQLLTLIDRQHGATKVGTKAVPGIAGRYWSATNSKVNPGYAWTVDLDLGFALLTRQQEQYQILLAATPGQASSTAATSHPKGTTSSANATRSAQPPPTSSSPSNAMGQTNRQRQTTMPSRSANHQYFPGYYPNAGYFGTLPYPQSHTIPSQYPYQGYVTPHQSAPQYRNHLQRPQYPGAWYYPSPR